MCPSMPLKVNSGTKPAMMMAAANRIDWLTSVAALAITRELAAEQVVAADHLQERAARRGAPPRFH